MGKLMSALKSAQKAKANYEMATGKRPLPKKPPRRPKG